MFRFENPYALQLFWLVPFVVVASVYLAKIHAVRLEKALGKKLLPFLTSSVSIPRRRWKLALEVICIIFALIAFARPQIGTSEQEIKSEGIELIIAFDVSSSMLAEDIKPSRLEFAKREMFRLIDLLSGNKVGIVAFAGSAALVAPMTTDRSALKMFIDSLSPESVSSQGTVFRKALIESREAFKRGGVGEDGEEDDGVASSVTRAILLVSDGEDNEKGAFDTVNELKKIGIHIFSLAFGTEKGAPIPVRDSSGRLAGYKRNKAGKTVLSQTKGTVLQKLAAAGSGSFYQVRFGGNAIEKLAADINKLEKSEFENQTITTYAERYQIFLFIAFLIALIELLIGERFVGREIWRGRFEVPQK